MNFQDLGLSPKLLEQIKRVGFTEPTPIQEKAIPHVLAGEDLLGCAQTGTGKTAAFALPILQALLGGEASGQLPYALVLAPTRELADQICESFAQLSPSKDWRVVLLVGGAAMPPQIKGLRAGPHVVVATPGRLLDHLERRNVKLDGVGVFVLDEADRMLDMGFIPQVERILRHLPKKRQSLFFSATLPVSLGGIQHRVLRNPVRIDIAPLGHTAEGIEQWAYPVDPRSKMELLRYLLETVPGSTLIFVKTKSGTEEVYNALKSGGQSVDVIHGDRSQSERNRALERFKEGEVRILVATDVASRGLDVEGIAHVINYDIPTDPESYVHRVGRTARAGAVGRASLFVGFGETRDLKVIEGLIGESISEGQVPEGTLCHTALAPSFKPVRGGRRRGARRYV